MLQTGKTVTDADVEVMIRQIMDHVFDGKPYRIKEIIRHDKQREVVVEYHRAGYMYEDEFFINNVVFFSDNIILAYEENIIYSQITEQEHAIEASTRCIQGLRRQLIQLRGKFNVD